MRTFFEQVRHESTTLKAIFVPHLSDLSDFCSVITQFCSVIDMVATESEKNEESQWKVLEFKQVIGT